MYRGYCGEALTREGREARGTVYDCRLVFFLATRPAKVNDRIRGEYNLKAYPIFCVQAAEIARFELLDLLDCNKPF
jgi:hypothetical protein